MDMVKILIVEDERLIAKVLAKNLKQIGYNVVAIIDSGELALEKIPQLKPDLVLMDIIIKGEIDGVEAASQIYKKYNIPIIFVTAYTDENVLAMGKEIGCYGYVVKPCKKQELNTAIDLALKKHQESFPVTNNE